MSDNKLKIGLLVDSYSVPAWIYRVIERVLLSNCIEISQVIINCSAGKTSSHPFHDINKLKPALLYQIINSLDKKFFIRGSNSLEHKNLDKLLKGIPFLEVTPILNDGFDTFNPNDIEQVQKMKLDILVKFGFNNIKGDIISSIRYGVWAYHFGNKKHDERNYAGYWEVIKKEPLTTASLFAWNNETNPVRILYQSGISTFMFSPARNQNSIFWFASAFLVRQMEILSKFGIDRLYAESTRFNDPDKIDEIKPAKPPNNLEALKSAVILLGRIFKEVVIRLLSKDFWYLLFDIRDNSSLEIKSFQKLIPPKDRFWADPFIVQESGNYFIFVEELFYKKRKGQISVIEMDSQGNHRESIPILEKNFHLSYPCVFQTNGSYFMVPESGANKTIDLYECEIFPAKWNFKMTLMEGVSAVDTTMFFYNDKWWLFTGLRENAGGYTDVELFLFYSDTLFTNKWNSHPLNPVVSDVTNARPAGQIYTQNKKLYRPSQDSTQYYGNKFSINEILCLNETDYKEKKITTVGPDWDNKVQATHTYNRVGKLSIIDAYYQKMKLFN
jgi:hypothetical protein